jgi:hypothetical protein
VRERRQQSVFCVQQGLPADLHFRKRVQIPILEQMTRIEDFSSEGKLPPSQNPPEASAFDITAAGSPV